MQSTKIMIAITVTLFLIINLSIFGFIFYKKMNSTAITNPVAMENNYPINTTERTELIQTIPTNPIKTSPIQPTTNSSILDNSNYESIGRPIQTNKEFRILSPFANDVFIFNKSIPSHFQLIELIATHEAEWWVDDKKIGTGRQVSWPAKQGVHEIKAQWNQEIRRVNISIQSR